MQLFAPFFTQHRGASTIPSLHSTCSRGMFGIINTLSTIFKIQHCPWKQLLSFCFGGRRCAYIYIYCYHRSSVNIAFGVSRSELTKPGDQSMAGFDFINKYHQKWWSEHGWTWSHRSIHIEMNYQIVIRFYVFNLILPQHRDHLMFSIWFYLNIVMHLIKPD